LQEVCDFAVERNTLEISPVVDIDRHVLQAYCKTLASARRQLTVSGLRASEFEKITESESRASSPFDSKDDDGSLGAMSVDISDIWRELDEPQGELPPTVVRSDSSQVPEKPLSNIRVGDVEAGVAHSSRNGSVQGQDGLQATFIFAAPVPTHSNIAEEAHPVVPPQVARATSPAMDSSNDPVSDSSDFDASKDLDSSTRGDSIPGPVGSSTQSQVTEEVHTGPPLVASTTLPHASKEVDESMSQASNNIPGPEVAVD
ncbi:hypothetical protein V5O48_013177, partial [Marasmius crinis-equi]